MILVLSGFMGCGKSTVGRLTADLTAGSGSLPSQEFASLTPPSAEADGPPASVPRVARPSKGAAGPGLEFVDLDEEIIRRTGRSIPEIFAADGEAGFREIERETLRSLLTLEINTPPTSKDLLISLGGGTLTDPENRAMVRKYGKCIYLRASLETLAANLRREGETLSRPMLAGTDPDTPGSLEARIAALMAERAPVYENAADVIIDIDGCSFENLARQILALR